MPFEAIAYGIRLLSDVAIPGLLAAETSVSNPPVRVWLAGTPPEWAPLWQAVGEPWYSSEHPGASGEPTLQVARLPASSFFRFRYSDATEFLVRADGSEIAARWPSRLTLEDAATYLLGPVLGFVLRLRGVTCLHASAVAIGDQAIALVGPPGAGKSTTAAALAQRNLAVLSDDVAALEWRDARAWIHPGYPRLNLWPDSVAALFGAPDRQPLVTPGWEKRYVDPANSGYRFSAKAAPLAAVYLLSPDDAATGPRIEPLPKPLAIVSLVTNTYVNYLIDAGQRGREFEAMGRLVKQVPVRRVLYGRTPDAFANLPDAILADARAVIPAGQD